MPQDERPPLRFWVGLHRDGSGRQCKVDFHGGPMAGVKAAWSADNPKRLTTLEAMVQPKLTAASSAYLDLLKKLERQLGDSRLPSLEDLLGAVFMAGYEAGLVRDAERDSMKLPPSLPGDRAAE